MKNVVNYNVLYSSDYILIVLSRASFESLWYSLFFTCKVGVIIHIVDGCCEIWVCELLEYSVWSLRASCKFDFQLYYKNAVFVSHWQDALKS